MRFKKSSLFYACITSLVRIAHSVDRSNDEDCGGQRGNRIQHVASFFVTRSRDNRGSLLFTEIAFLEE